MLLHDDFLKCKILRRSSCLLFFLLLLLLLIWRRLNTFCCLLLLLLLLWLRVKEVIYSHVNVTVVAFESSHNTVLGHNVAKHFCYCLYLSFVRSVCFYSLFFHGSCTTTHLLILILIIIIIIIIIITVVITTIIINTIATVIIRILHRLKTHTMHVFWTAHHIECPL